jgi:hypothetical protein
VFPSNLYINNKNYKQENLPLFDGKLPSDYFFVRVLHELELDESLHTTPASRPEVRQLFPANLFSPFDRGWQMLAWDMNPYCTAGNITSVYHFRLWVVNNNGFGDSSHPRRNYFENTHLSDPLPKVEAITCGGNLLHVIGEAMVKTNNGLEDCYIIETLDYHNLPPTVEWMDKHPWLITWAVNMGSDGTPRRFTYGMQPNGFIPGVKHPFLSNPRDYQIAIQKWRCSSRWTESFAPDPYRVYLPR